MSGTGSHQAQSFQIANLLEKMNSADKDYRFMATNDLMTELSKDSIKLDEDSERKVVRMLLKLLEDKNGEVQNLAVKCLGPLVNKVKDTQVENIVDTLCCNMRAAENEQLRDVSSIGLKTVIHALPPSSSALASNICKRITPQLTSAIGQNDVQPVQLEALDILAELLLRHGGVLINFHTSIQEALLPQLASPRLAIRKRTITALSHLVGTCSGNDFQRIMNYLVEQLQVNKEISTTRTYVNAVASVCRAAGHRFGEYLDTVMKLLMNFCTREDDELRESCIQAFESFVVRCPREVATWIRPIIELCAKFLCYDPNYHYEDADSGMNGDMSGDDPSASESDQEYSDDEDMSWKVRRASAKCLEAILVTRRELLLEFYETISPLLISRFKEREENVKTDIFSAYVALLKHTKVAMPSSRDYMNAEDDRTEARKLASKVEEEIPKIVATLTKQLRDKSIKTRQSCFSLLQQLLLLMPGALGGQMSHLIPGILYSLSEKSSNQSMKIETLSFLRVAISTHPPEVFQPHVRDLVPMVLNVVDDSFYKVIGEALAVIQQLMQVMRPVSGDMSDFDYQPYVQQTYDVIHARLKATDIDQEVKERAISCAGQFVASFGDQYPNYVQSCMPLLLDRLRNEITRLTCVRALITVIQSAYPVNVAAYLPDAVPELASFLRKNQRVLKLATLQLLTAMAADRYAHVLKSSEGLNEVLTEIPPLLSEADLQIAQMAADFLTRVLRLNSDAVLQHLNAALEQLGKLILSPLLQGTSLETVLSFLATLMETGLPNMTFNGLVQMLVQPIHDTTKVHKTGYRNTGKAIAVLCAYNPAESGRIVGEMISQLQSKTSSEGVVYFSLICLGEIGRIYPEALKQLSIEKLILEAFHSNKEDIQKAASQALGLVAAGNLEKYLPFVLKEIQSQRNRQYLLLIALKEIISAESDDERHIQILSPHVPDIWKVLIDHSQCAEEGTRDVPVATTCAGGTTTGTRPVVGATGAGVSRNVVSECLGRLTLLDPVSLLPKLKGHLGSPSALARATVITALKFTIADQPQPIDPYLKACIGEFLRALRDEDLLVRRVALVTFNSAGHNKPVLIRDLLDELLPALYHETKVRKDLVREVEMGPFKHTVDDGLDLRKAAFECMYTLLETCLERLDIFVFLEHVEDGLKDHYDIKMLTYLMLVRLSHLCPTQVLQRVEQLIEPMKQVCTAKVKANSVKQEFEKNDELKRACIRAFVALQQIPEAERNPQVNDFLASLRQSPDTAGMVDSILKDPSKQIYGDAGDNMEIG